MLCLGLLPFFCHISLFLTLSLFSSFSFCSLSPSLYNGFCLSSSPFLSYFISFLLFQLHILFPFFSSSIFRFHVHFLISFLCYILLPGFFMLLLFHLITFPSHSFCARIDSLFSPSPSTSSFRSLLTDVSLHPSLFLSNGELCVLGRLSFLPFVSWPFYFLLFYLFCCSQYSGNIMPIINLILSFYFLHLRKMWCYILHISYPIPEQLPSSPKNSQNQTKRLCLKFVLYSVLYSLPGVSESNGERGACHLALRNTCLTCEYVCEIWLFFFLLLTNI